MDLVDDPLHVAGAERIRRRPPTFSAMVPEVGVGIAWVVFGRTVALAELRDFRAKKRWSWDWS